MYEQKTGKLFASIIIAGLGIFLGYLLWPYKNGIFGALILYVLLKPLYQYIHEKRKWSQTSTIALLFVSCTLIVLLPLILVGFLVLGEVDQATGLGDNLQGQVDEVLTQYPQFAQYINTEQLVTKGIALLERSILSLIGNLSSLLISLIIMYFLLFYLFKSGDKLGNGMRKVLPFIPKHTNLLMAEFTKITNAVIISTGIIAVLQGGLLTFGMIIVDVPGALLWGLVATICAFIPFLGVVIVWVPLAIYLFLKGAVGATIFIVILGIIISNIDNILRPLIQEKIGRLHPLISLIGVFIGLPAFGLLGIVIGPLLISYFLLLVDVYQKEYSS